MCKVKLWNLRQPIEYNGVEVAAYGRKQMGLCDDVCYSSEAYGFGPVDGRLDGQDDHGCLRRKT